MESRRTTLIFLCLLLGCVLLSIALRWQMTRYPLTVDEGSYAYITYFWQHGKKLYTDVWLDRPQGIFVIYRLIFDTLGYSTQAIRLFAALYNSLTVVAIGLLGKKLFNWKVGALSAFLFAIFSAGIAIEGFTANTELFMMLPIVLSLYFLASSNNLNSPADNFKLFLCGIFAAIALLIKGSGISAIILAISYLILFKQVKNKRKAIIFLLAGFLLSLLPAIIHGIILGIGNYTWAIIGWRLTKYSILSPAHGNEFNNLISTTSKVIPETLFLWILTVIWAFFVGRKPYNQKLLLDIFLISSILGISMGGDWYRHYFVQIIPALSLIGAYTLKFLLKNFKTKTLLLVLTSPLILSSVYCYLFFNLRPYTNYNRLIKDPYIYNNSYFKYSENDQVANFIQQTTNLKDTIYVLFSQAQIYYLARRMPAYNKTFVAHVLTDPNFDKNLSQIISSEKAPKYLIIYDSTLPILDKFPTLKTKIVKYYSLEKEINGIKILRNSNNLKTG